MRIRVELGVRAEDDLEEIGAYLQREAGRRTADSVTQNILQTIILLEEHPRLGVSREDLGANRRLLIIRSYVAIYEIGRDERGEYVSVLRIAHGARDLPGLLAKH